MKTKPNHKVGLFRKFKDCMSKKFSKFAEFLEGLKTVLSHDISNACLDQRDADCIPQNTSVMLGDEFSTKNQTPEVCP